MAAAASFRRVPCGYRRPRRKIYRESPFSGSQQPARLMARVRASENEEIGIRAAIFIRSFTAVRGFSPCHTVDRLTFPQFHPLSSFARSSAFSTLSFLDSGIDLRTRPLDPKVIMQYQRRLFAGSFRSYFSRFCQRDGLSLAPAVTIIYEGCVLGIRHAVSRCQVTRAEVTATTS